MAEGTLRFGRGAYDIAHKIDHRSLLENVNKHGKGAVRVSSLSAGFLLSDIQNGKLCGAENAADGARVVTQGVSRNSYTRVNRLLGVQSSVNEREFVVGNNGYLGLNKKHAVKKLQVKFPDRNLTRSWSHAALRRTFGSSRCVGPDQSLGSRRVWWEHGSFVFIRAYSGNGSRSEPLYKTKTGYYEILEVSPTATHAQIKTAYYKQSFVYHPDRNAGSGEATVRFSEISEAYTVLGNKGLRKKYDRGLLSQSDLTTARPSGKETTVSSAKQHTGSRQSVVGAEGRDRVFDFDKFFKDHYSEQLQRDRDIRVRKEEMLRRKRESIGDRKLDRMLEMGVGLMLAMAMLILMSLKRG